MAPVALASILRKVVLFGLEATSINYDIITYTSRWRSNTELSTEVTESTTGVDASVF